MPSRGGALPTFRVTLLHTGVHNVGVPLTEAQLAAIGGGKRPHVRVVLNGYEYHSTVGVISGRLLIPVSAAIRKAASVAGGETHQVTITLDPDPRDAPVPGDLSRGLDDAHLRAVFDKLAPSRRKELVRSIEETANLRARARRVAEVVDLLRAEPHHR